jgi:hypothetical protein
MIIHLQTSVKFYVAQCWTEEIIANGWKNGTVKLVMVGQSFNEPFFVQGWKPRVQIGYDLQMLLYAS